MGVADTPDAIFCLDCGYDLHACQAESCPECGRHFSRQMSWTFRQPHDFSQRVRTCRALIVLLVAYSLAWFGWLIVFKYFVMPDDAYPMSRLLLAMKFAWSTLGGLPLVFIAETPHAIALAWLWPAFVVMGYFATIRATFVGDIPTSRHLLIATIWLLLSMLISLPALGS